MSHLRTEETLPDEGELASGPWWCFGFFCWVFGCFLRFLFLCYFPLHHAVFPFLSMMTWAPRPHGVRTRGKKRKETTEEESYVPATGQGCFSFEMSLLQRAAQTFAKRSVADHYMQVARWLHTGLARPSRGKVGIFCPSTAHTPPPPSPCFVYTSKSDTSPRNNQTKRSPMLRPTYKARLCATGNDTSTKSSLRAILQRPIASVQRERPVRRLTIFA